MRCVRGGKRRKREKRKNKGKKEKGSKQGKKKNKLSNFLEIVIHNLH
jgi:hypothetical protein